MRLIIVRHGETIENLTGINMGQTPGTLTSLGQKQAERVAERLKSERFDAVYASDLRRVIDTAQPILRYHPATPIYQTISLREINRAPLEGGSIAQLHEFVEVELRKGVPHGQVRTSAGESVEDVARRMVDHYQACRKQHQDQSVLWVSHGMAISAFLCTLFGYGLDRPTMLKYVLGNTRVTKISVDEASKPRLDLFNCLKHIE